ncbi:LacI family DNA-binding transcriptional regulator [Rathayibacter oskolensis]|uniref:LacI family DNA-binding transcriptional regulator n=1 Tax=Rathayibacter oskolensis TaxID=1891671 RepID=UPI00265FA0E7|nr:LacI family DNA-binding transcriptional regulator [Rathayibacter oskolensis]WKK72422.1 LacI family DNA-binding transcriptional regulator [Rathayibacter oskolensis]
MAQPRRRATLASVAESAGVSLKTASNAVNGTGRMSEQTRARVEAAVRELGYTVNIAARSLTRGARTRSPWRSRRSRRRTSPSWPRPSSRRRATWASRST